MTIFVPNPKLQSDLQAQPEFQDALADKADKVKSAVENVAPTRTGAYRRSIRVVRDGNRVLVATMDPFGHLVEWGSAKNPPYAPLRRGARAAGMRVDEK